MSRSGPRDRQFGDMDGLDIGICERMFANHADRSSGSIRDDDIAESLLCHQARHVHRGDILRQGKDRL